MPDPDPSDPALFDACQREARAAFALACLDSGEPPPEVLVWVDMALTAGIVGSLRAFDPER